MLEKIRRKGGRVKKKRHVTNGGKTEGPKTKQTKGSEQQAIQLHPKFLGIEQQFYIWGFPFLIFYVYI